MFSYQKIMKFIKLLSILVITAFFLTSCGGKLPGADAKKYPPDPKERVKRNLEEGRGFRISNIGKQGSGTFEFASSNELWRATLDIIDFMPLVSANYSGGVIITDWYSENNNNESIKITVRFLSNEVRSDSVSIKIFYKICDINLSCTITEKSGLLNKKIKKEIWNQAANYEKKKKDNNFEPYPGKQNF